MRYALVLLVLVAAGCAGTAERFNRLSLGMNKPQVVRTVGKPYTTGASGDTEFLRYWDKDSQEEYFVKLQNGQVESYGKIGDFNSTKNPTNDINLNIKNSHGS